jgi:hypothetical protein
VAGVVWVVLFALLLLSPAARDGHNFGPTDLGSGLSALTQGSVATQADCLTSAGAPTTGCPHNDINGDIIDQDVPWNTTDWQLVHHGQFPFWDAQAGTGEPQLLNFESSVLALPTLVGYLVPLSWSFLVTVLMKLLLAGLGTYWCARVLGARPSAAALGGTSFMLSGAFAGWLGWPISGPIALAGVVVAALVLAYRTRARVWPVVVLACGVAFTIFGGFPEEYALIAIAFAVLLAVGGIVAIATGRGIARDGIARLVAGVAGGFGLSAVLWLPGISVLSKAARGGQTAAVARPLHDAALIFVPGYSGLPIAGSTFFGTQDYFETAASVSLVTIALAIVAVVFGRRRATVTGLGAMVVASLLITYAIGSVAPVQRLFIDVGLKSLNLGRSVLIVDFGLALLGALGAEVLIARLGERSVRRTFDGAVAAVAAVVVVLGIRAVDSNLSPALAHLRRQAMEWPVATVLVLAVVAIVAEVVHARPLAAGRGVDRAVRLLPLVLVATASAASLFAEVGINSYAHTAYPETAATLELERIVGGGLLGLDGGNATVTAASPGGLRQWEGVGFYPNMNTAYGVDELGVHDPIVSSQYFAAWPVPGADPGGALNLFVPDVDTVALARRYGVNYVLSAPGFSAPKGMTPVAKIGSEVLSKVPGSGRFTIGDAPGHLLVGSQHGDATYVVQTNGRSGRLIARITNSPGWRASGDGRPLSVRSFEGSFLSIEVPPGVTAVTLHYRPPHLAEAIVLTLATVLGFLAAGAWSLRRRSGPVPSDGVEAHAEPATVLV